MPVYSSRFSDAIYGGNATDHPLFTVPAGRVWVVRFLTIWTDVSGNEAMIEHPGGARWVYFKSTAANQSLGGEVRLVLRASETLSFHIFTGGWHVSTHGFDLTA